MNFSLIKRFANKISDDDIFALSAQFSYYIILGIFPFMFLLVIFMGYYSNSLFDILNSFKNFIPKEIYSLLISLTSDSVANYKLPYFSVSIIVLLWSASSGSVGIIKGINKANDCTIKKNYIFMKTFGLLFTLALTISFQIALFVIVIGRYILNYLPKIIKVTHFLLTLIQVIRLVLPILLLVIIISLVYKFIPYKKIKFKSVLPGSIIATLGCIISSLTFSVYVNFKSNFYSNIYGNLSGIFILLLWVYMTSFIFLLGAEINAFLIRENITFKKFFNIK
ncbi:YihY/virulence factor BrkB family protein [Sedimentibacter sp. zth1]|uniref:YihY/virulence factor BrkB family protein n=1 Tax=Sedimentibacter sp. zth1 TaxID=2816908 RepID=UPI001A91AE5C|nr:YihY/virulence factor BrkB family protein [Sedimentibacter sp. zth1]QSX07005.1 YihY/virulence factor BrkB family protein [Sedimentibacter sp. zth1]